MISMKMSNIVNWDFLNFVVAVIALLIAVYSVWYTKMCNRRRLFIQNGTITEVSSDRYIVRFELVNMSPSPVTLKNISFNDNNQSPIEPLWDYEPERTYSEESLGFGLVQKIPDYISEDMYADMLDGDYVLNPFETEPFGYYFDRHMNDISIKVACAERIHFFKKHRLFLTHLSDVED